MGWSVSGEGTLEIAAARQRDAFAALLPLAMSEGLRAKRPETLATSGDLISFLTRAGFLVAVEDTGDIVGLEFLSEPLGDDHRMAGSLNQILVLDTLAPFISAGGQMVFINEDEDEFIHRFDGSRMLGPDDASLSSGASS